MGGRLGAEAAGVDRLPVAGDDIIVDPILGKPRPVVTPQPARVAFVVAKQEFGGAVADEPQRHELGVLDTNRVLSVRRETRLRGPGLPSPGVAGPNLRQEAQRRPVGAAVVHRQLHQDVVDAALGVFDLDIEITPAVEDPGVDQLILGILRRPPPVLFDQFVVRECGLRILIKHPHVGMRWRAVEIVIEFLDVFAVIALLIGQPEQPLLQDRVALVPQGDREAQVKMIVAKPADAVFAPAIGPAARVIVREVFPCVAIGAVILAHRPPLAIADIGTPAPPLDAVAGFRQPASFGRLRDDVERLPRGVASSLPPKLPSRRQLRLCDKSLAPIVRRGSAMVKVWARRVMSQFGVSGHPSCRRIRRVLPQFGHPRAAS